MHKRIFTFVLVFITTVGVGLVWSSHLLKPPSTDFCTGEGYLPSDGNINSVHAIKVVVEPWLGEHHVYGIFQVDSHKCPPGHPVILTVVGGGKYCEATNPIGQSFQDIEASAGHYLSKHFVRTRTALWSSLHGSFYQLQQPQNWKLTYETTE